LTLAAQNVVTTAVATVVTVNSGVTGYQAQGITQDLANRLYLAASNEQAILLAQDVTQTPATYAGIPGSPGLKNGARLQSQFHGPSFLAFDQAQGTLYVSDAANNVIRRVTPGTSGAVDTLAGTGVGFNNPQGLALDGRGYLWVADSGNHTIRRINLVTGVVQTVAGLAGVPGAADGTGSGARFMLPAGLAVEAETAAEELARELLGQPPPPVSVIVADAGNGILRRVDDSGHVTTIGTTGAAVFAAPSGVAVDPFGNIFVSEPGAGRVKVLLKETGQIVPVSRANTFQNPGGISITRAGTIVVADGNHGAQGIRFGAPTITRITPGHVGYQGGTQITIEGTNFAPDSIVIAAGVILRSSVDDTGYIHATAPSAPNALPSGVTTLTVQNRGGLAQASLQVDAIAFDTLPAGYITTIAGGSTFIGDGAAGSNAVIGPQGIAVDANGNLFIVDASNSRIRRVDARTGIITTVAGNGIAGFSGDGGPALLASLDSPSVVAFDAGGNLLIGEYFHGRIRSVDARTGIITTIAGSPGSDLGDNGPALQASINPNAIALDAAGNIFIAEYYGSRVRRIDAQTKIIATVAGNGQDGASGDGGLATNASLNRPGGLAVDKAGNIFIGDASWRIRRVDAHTKIISTVAGTGEYGFCDDGTPALSCPMTSTLGFTFDPDGNLLFSDNNSNRHRVRKLTFATGIITTVAGRSDSDESFSGDGGPATQAGILPGAAALDAAGNLFIVHNPGYPNGRVRRVDGRTGIISTVAGNGNEAIIGDNGPATSASIYNPRAIAFDHNGNLFVASSRDYFSRVRKIDSASGLITTVMGCGESFCPQADGTLATGFSLFEPYGVSFDAAQNMYVSADYCCVLKVDSATHRVTNVAGGGNPADGVGDNGLATSAFLGIPESGAIFESGGSKNLYTIGPDRKRVRKIDLNTGIITTVAGDLCSAIDLVIDRDANILIADSCGAIRRVSALTGNITTVAGGGTDQNINIPATSAQISPRAVALDPNGRLFFFDSIRDGVLMIDASNRIVPIAGGAWSNSDYGFAGDNGPAITAKFSIEYGHLLTFDSSGNLYIADQDNNRIRAVRGPIP
jgi:sugar lactone lactonase YvrE